MVQIICVFFFCIGFGILFHIRGWNLFLGGIGGCLAWLTYLLTDSIGRTDIMAYFCGTVVMTLYAEIAAYYRKVPVSVFLGVEMIPLVPGKIFFYTMVNLFFGYERFVYEKVAVKFTPCPAILILCTRHGGITQSGFARLSIQCWGIRPEDLCAVLM